MVFWRETLRRATWPGRHEEIHPVWPLVVAAVSAGGGLVRSGNPVDAGRGGLGSDGSGNLKRVLQAMWTQVVPVMSHCVHVCL